MEKPLHFSPLFVGAAYTPPVELCGHGSIPGRPVGRPYILPKGFPSPRPHFSTPTHRNVENKTEKFSFPPHGTAGLKPRPTANREFTSTFSTPATGNVENPRFFSPPHIFHTPVENIPGLASPVNCGRRFLPCREGPKTPNKNARQEIEPNQQKQTIDKIPLM